MCLQLTRDKSIPGFFDHWAASFSSLPVLSPERERPVIKLVSQLNPIRRWLAVSLKTMIKNPRGIPGSFRRLFVQGCCFVPVSSSVGDDPSRQREQPPLPRCGRRAMSDDDQFSS